MSALDDGLWRTLPERDKQELRDRLAETAAKVGRPIGGPPTAGELAHTHEPTLTVQRPHLDLIDEQLEHVLATPNAKLMIWTPPQVGKSSRVSRWFPFWWLTHRPQDRVILASYAARLAETHGAACRDLISTYGAQYGLRLKDDESTRSDWTLTSGGGMRARGVRGGLTGNPLDLGIIDDPFSDRAAADSPVIRDAVWEWYSSAWVSRKSPEAREIIVMTRWHQLDLCGMLLEREGRVEDGGEWTVLHMPAVAVPEDRKRGFYPDPLGRDVGEPLSHPKIPIDDRAALAKHWARKKAGSTNRDWDALYQGSPVTAEGALLNEDSIRNASTNDVPAARRAVVGVDPSGGGRDTAGIIGGHLGTDGKAYWTHNRTERMSSDVWSREACLLAYEIDATRIVFENNYGGDQAGTLIKQAWKFLQLEEEIPPTALCPLITSVNAKKSKFLRAEPIAQAVLTGRCWFTNDPQLRDLKSEWELWEPDSTWSPGALDAAVYVAMELLPIIANGATAQSVAKRKQGSATAHGVAARRVAR